MEIIKQQHDFSLTPVICADAVTSPPRDSQAAAVEVPSELRGVLFGEAINVPRPARYAGRVNDLFLADEQCSLARLDMTSNDIKDVPNVFPTIWFLPKPSAQCARRDGWDMNDFEAVVMSLGDGSVLPPRA